MRSWTRRSSRPVSERSCCATDASRPASAFSPLRLTTNTLQSVMASADKVCASANSRPKISPGRIPRVIVLACKGWQNSIAMDDEVMQRYVHGGYFVADGGAVSYEEYDPFLFHPALFVCVTPLCIQYTPTAFDTRDRLHRNIALYKPREHRAAFVINSLEASEGATLHIRQGEHA